MTAGERKLKRELVELTSVILNVENSIDLLMKREHSDDRDKLFARVMNALTMANQGAMLHGLDYSWKKINKLYGKQP
jgi:hypothetical protein